MLFIPAAVGAAILTWPLAFSGRGLESETCPTKLYIIGLLTSSITSFCVVIGVLVSIVFYARSQMKAKEADTVVLPKSLEGVQIEKGTQEHAGTDENDQV